MLDQYSVIDEIHLCPDCDLVIALPKLGEQQEALCPRCAHTIVSARPHHEHRLLALVLTGLLLLFPANFYPVLYMQLAGQQQSSRIWDGVLSLWNEGYSVVSVLVLGAAILIPLLRLIVLLPVLLAANWQKGLWPARRLFRRYVLMCEWGMIEIYMLGVVVTVIKLADLASVQLGVGLYCFIGLMLIEMAISLNMNEAHLWQLLGSKQ